MNYQGTLHQILSNPDIQTALLMPEKDESAGDDAAKSKTSTLTSCIVNSRKDESARDNASNSRRSRLTS
jgi:hypothetical protein